MIRSEGNVKLKNLRTVHALGDHGVPQVVLAYRAPENCLAEMESMSAYHKPRSTR
jgi:hypothetical protein